MSSRPPHAREEIPMRETSKIWMNGELVDWADATVRVGTNVIPHVAKATGVYLNSMLAVQEALRAGYEEAILLTHDGYVADGSGENIFVVKDGVISTPDLSASILPGITRDTIIQIA